jgi:uncharacterized membrane protein YdbT with pleckstrin-like domain
MHFFLLLFIISIGSPIQEEPVDKTKHWGDLEEEEEEEEEEEDEEEEEEEQLDEEELEDGAQSVDSLSRYWIEFFTSRCLLAHASCNHVHCLLIKVIVCLSMILPLIPCTCVIGPSHM